MTEVHYSIRVSYGRYIGKGCSEIWKDRRAHSREREREIDTRKLAMGVYENTMTIYAGGSISFFMFSTSFFLE